MRSAERRRYRVRCVLRCLLPGCDALGPRKPTAEVVGVALKDIRLDAATPRFDVEVTNPHAVPLPLVGVDYQLASRARPFLTGRADLQGTIPARGRLCPTRRS